MHTYRVTGVFLVCLHTRWLKGRSTSEVRAPDRHTAMNAALAPHKEAAERRDPDATVRWRVVRVQRLEALEWQA